MELDIKDAVGVFKTYIIMEIIIFVVFKNKFNRKPCILYVGNFFLFIQKFFKNNTGSLRQNTILTARSTNLDSSFYFFKMPSLIPS